MTAEEAKANLEKLLLLYDDGMIDFSTIRESIKMAIEALRQMSGTSDLISRQAAVDAICKEWCCCSHDDCENKNMMEAGFDPCDGCSDVDAIMDLPSVEPEIIHCKDCTNWKVQVKDVKGDGLGCCNFHNANFVTSEGYC